ncbi:hypothetical protein AB0O47_39475 [Streptomyces noursei]|uniref:hypothetical protein n=1 Tax=Streptomyces noursei TaxID=1971 RepID=UPI00344FBEB1
MTEYEELATHVLRKVLRDAGWEEDAVHYRCQVIYNGAEPVCLTGQQRARARVVAERLAREMGLAASWVQGGGGGE